MPQLFRSAVMTNDGIALLTKAMAGECEMQFTSIAVGDGVYEGDERSFNFLQSRHDLKAKKQEVGLNSIQIVSEKCVKVKGVISNSELEVGYYMNEMGIFCQEKDNPATKILYSLAILLDDIPVGDYMPPYNGVNPASVLQEYYATVSSADDVTIEIIEGTYALAEDFEKYKADTDKSLNDIDYFINTGMYGFIYCESEETVLNRIGCYYDGPKPQTIIQDESGETIRVISGENPETICIPEEVTNYDEETETLELAPGIPIAPYTPGGGGGGGGYVLPVATATRLGGVKIGEGINVRSDGTISINAQQTAEAAADLVERNATEPSDEQIDDLFSEEESEGAGEE